MKVQVDQTVKITKKLILYAAGLFFLALGVSISIQAGLGVSPVSSLAYAFSLTAGLSIGVTTVLANILFILVQIILSKRIEMKDFMIQLIIAFLFGLFMDVTLFIAKLFPQPETIVMQFIYLFISLYVVSAGLFGYFTAKLPLMPYDALTAVISEQFKWKFSKAKVRSDVINVGVAGAICLLFIQSFGSIGIGTVIAALFIGKITGWIMDHFQKPVLLWINQEKSSDTNEVNETEAIAK